MNLKDRVQTDYLNWMYELMCEGRFAKAISYKRLFMFLHDTEFTWFVEHDENRAADGISLRRRYCLDNNCIDLQHYLDGPCSVLEMMIALAIREESIMCDPDRGDRTSQWFWGMINSLGLGAMYDHNFDEQLAIDIIVRFLDREYSPNGKGGLFTIRGWNRDARYAEIWHQLMAYLNTIV